MENELIGLVMFLLVVYAFFTMFMTISGFETKKQSKITGIGFAVIAIFTIGIFWDVEGSIFRALSYLLPLYFMYNFMQILSNTTHKKGLLHLMNFSAAGLIAYLIL